MKAEENKVILTIRVDPKIKRALEIAAAGRLKAGIKPYSVSHLVEHALKKEYMEK